MAYLEREDGKRVYFEDHGNGDAALVLIHGWGMNLRTWDCSLPALIAAGPRVVALDHRGCGQSDKDFADMGIEAIAGDVCALVEHLGLKRVVLNGWSLGGAVAVSAASALGPACVGLVLTCGATPAYLQKPEFPHGGTEEAMAETVAALSSDRVNFLHTLAQGVCATPVSEATVEWLWRIFMDASPRAAETLAQLGPLDQREQLAGLNTPILAFVGGQDAVVDPAVCRSVADYNTGARLVELPDVGHAPFLEDAPRYQQELTGFLGQHLN